MLRPGSRGRGQGRWVGRYETKDEVYFLSDAVLRRHTAYIVDQLVAFSRARGKLGSYFKSSIL